MKPAQPNPVIAFARRIPTPIALAIGVLLGLCVSQLWSSSQSGQAYPTWDGGSSLKSQRPHRLNSFQPTVVPTADQRFRILTLLSTLSPHHTRTCTRNSQPSYVKQVTERYTTLVGHNQPSRGGFFGSWASAHEEEHTSSTRRRSELAALGHKYFFAINLYNSFDVIPDLFATLFRVAAVLGYHNVFVSIYENGSTDQTKALLRIFDSLTRSVGMRVVIRTSMRRRGAFNHRIEYLAEVRNAAMVPLHELRENEGEVFDSVVFMNDVLPCIDDVLELIWQSRRQNAGTGTR
ncbi:capsular associated protein [Ceratobasidium sp. 394]|nr:capsular associated protein [Ceratobasidium sp. 394]